MFHSRNQLGHYGNDKSPADYVDEQCDKNKADGCLLFHSGPKIVENQIGIRVFLLNGCHDISRIFISLALKSGYDAEQKGLCCITGKSFYNCWNCSDKTSGRT